MREITKHGQSGYRRGCRCEECRAGHRADVAKWRAARRTPAPPAAEAPLPDLTSVPVPDPSPAPGAIESAVSADLAALVGEPPWKTTLSALAVYNARLLDQLMSLDRLDLISPIQLRTLEVLNRLRAVSESTSPATDAEAFLRDLSDAS